MATNAFRRSASRYSDAAAAQSPYAKAGQVWDDRIGGARAQAQSWRIAAFCAFGLTALTLGAYIYERQDTRIATYVVPVDQYGRTGQIELAGRAYIPSNAETSYFLGDWVKRVRAKSIDPIVIRDDWRSAYAFVSGSAVGQLNDYARAHDPFANLGQSATTVEIISVLPRSPATYQVSWRETATMSGVTSPPERWTGLFTVAVQPPRTEEQLRANPLGIFITNLQWSREL